MFGQSDDVFANIPEEHHPEHSAPSPAPEAHVAAMPGMAAPGAFVPERPAPMMLSGEIPGLEPSDVTSQAAIRSAGITTLLAAIAIGGGLALGGPWGAVSGLTFVGAVSNGYRAQKWWGSPDPSEKHEAVVSAIFATLDTVAAAYAGYQAYQARKDDDE